MDVIWGYLSTMKSAEEQLMFKRLFKLGTASFKNNGNKGFSVCCKRAKHKLVLACLWRVLYLPFKLADDVNAVKFRPTRKAKSVIWDYKKLLP